MFTDKEIKKIKKVEPSAKVLNSKKARKAFEDGQIEGLE